MNILNQRIGDYFIEEKIAESYKSIIYRGSNSKSGENVLIKLLKKNFRSPSEIIQIKQESKILQNLKTDGILKNYDIIFNESEMIFIYEHINGTTLRNHLNKTNLNYYDFLNIAIPLVSIINDVHKENIVHKNLKPQNISVIISKNKVLEAKIFDFGFNIILNDQLSELYNPGVIETVLPYISPEQTGRMNLSTDFRTDLYSLGVIFYEMLVKRPPFFSPDPLEIIHSHLAKVPIPVHEIDKSIPVTISEIIQKLLSKSPEDRYHSASGLKIELEICLDQIRDTGRIYSLKPGDYDVSDKFIIPQKLIGREEEVKKILQAFDHISHGHSGVFLVSGVPGIGKSSIIKEVNKPIISSRGYFTSGKYDQMRKEVPFSSIIQAFQNLVRQILSESENKIQRWKRNLLTALGENGQVIIQVIPELELIIGSQPKIIELNPEESQNRFNHIFTSMIKVFANGDHPLVLFLDDVQWADSPSLSLLKAILSDKGVNNFLLILSYRETFLNYSHPFSLFIEDLKRQKTKMDKIHLKPLSIESVQVYLESVLTKSSENISSLTEIIYEKTRGNPFFLNQFIKNLYDEKIIFFITEIGWSWDLNKVKNMQVTENVIELMIIKINKLSENARTALIYGSCIGNRFSLDTLSQITSMSIEVTLDSINENISEGLIYISNNIYRFLHDRVQEAAYSLLPAKEKSRIHQKIGYMTLSGLDKNEIQDKIFYIVDHLNNSIDSMVDEIKILELIEFNLLAGKKALSSAAYEPSYHYMKMGIKLLEKLSKEKIWKDYYNISLQLYSYLAETSYLCLKYDEMESHTKIVLDNAQNILDIIKIYEIKIKTEIAKNNFLKGIEFGLEILSKLGIHFPKKPNRFHHSIELIKTMTFLKLKGEDYLVTSNSSQNPYILSSLRILSCINSVSYWVRPDLLPLLILKVVFLSLKYGSNIYTPYNLNGLGLILSEIGFIKSGERLGKMGLSLSEKQNSPDQKPRVSFVYYTFIHHWNTPLRESIKPLSDIFKKCLEVGDLEFASHSAFVDIYYSYSSGMELDDVQKKINQYLEDKKNLRYQTDLNAINIYQQSISNFQGKSKDNSKLKGKFYDIDLMLPLHLEAGDKTTLFHVYMISLYHSFMSNRFSRALEFSNKIIHVIEGSSSVYSQVTYYFYDSLVKIALIRQGGINNIKEIYNSINFNLSKLEKWNKYSPGNCKNKIYLIHAELKSLDEKSLDAIPLYENAIKSSRNNRFLQEEALSLELAAAYYLTIDFKDHAKNHILLSRSAYMKWGSSLMVSKIDNIYVNLLREPISSIPGTIGLSRNTSTNLDISTILKSAQVLSGEIDLNRLLAKILNVSIENAGAQRGILLLSKKGKLFVEAEASAMGGEIIFSVPLDDYRDLPHSIINYVNKTGQSIVLPHAYEKGMFTDDIYIYQKKMKSILCAPILHKGNLSGLLYLENNLSPNVFIKARLELLSILSVQAAISIENALLLSQREKSAKFDKEMEITASIQNSMVPEITKIPGFDVTGYMKPAEAVGGDYYDIINTPSKDWIAIGDVSGHGILSGLIMMMVQTSIHLSLSRGEELNPSKLLKIIINGIEDNIKKISKYQFKYMTITILCHEGNGLFTFTGQHQDLLIYRKNTGQIEYIPTEGIWIGLGKLNEESANSIQNKSFQMEIGDILLLYTDGITECEKDGKMLGIEGISNIIAKYNNNSSLTIKDKILEELETYTKKDDTTFLIIKKTE